MSAEISTMPSPSQDDRIMAALAHISAVLPFMGIVAPIIIWATQKDKSPYVHFQALQAVAYQLLVIVVGFLGMACYMCSFFSMFLFIPFSTATTRSDTTTVAPLFGLSFLLPFVILGILLLLSGVYYIYAIVAAVLTLQGKPFRYVILGRQVERFMQSGSAATKIA